MVPASDSPDPQPKRLPRWLRRPLSVGSTYQTTDSVIHGLDLHTICMYAHCPNQGECWARGTATVLILGSICTRNCRFCSVATGKPTPPDLSEPVRLAQMVAKMNLKYMVITSVNRDDLPDGGASHFRDCIQTVRQQYPDTQFEILTPDFQHCQQKALTLLKPAMPFVFAHNVETVPALYPKVRQGADYHLSLNLLKLAKQILGPIQTKSSIMLGFGETEEQVHNTLQDLRAVGCDRLTIGQYLKPSRESLDVVEFITPTKFTHWKEIALDMGFSWVISTPFARSSYHAEQDNTDALQNL